MMTRRGTAMTRATRAGRREPAPAAPGWLRAALLVAGPGLLIASGAIHLDLYLTGYRTIPTIGWLFLLQVIAAFALGLAVLATGGRPATVGPSAHGGRPVIAGWTAIAGRLAAAAGACFALATLGGYLLSIWTGLF